MRKWRRVRLKREGEKGGGEGWMMWRRDKTWVSERGW